MSLRLARDCSCWAPTGARLLCKPLALLGVGLWVSARMDSRRDCHFCDLITENPVRINCVSLLILFLLVRKIDDFVR